MVMEDDFAMVHYTARNGGASEGLADRLHSDFHIIGANAFSWIVELMGAISGRVPGRDV